MLEEFKAFAMRGNVVDMAVGIVIGVAFGKIVSTLVGNIIMPVVGLITGGVDFSDKKIVLKSAVLDPLGKVTTPEVAVGYGVFINTIIDFVIVAFALFMVIKLMNRLQRKAAVETAKPAAPPEPTKQEVLLAEIRDLLRTQNGAKVG
jgi:large conductance mechanosensitive channel